MANFTSMFGDIKSKLGIGGQGQQQDDYAEYDEYDEYADYAEDDPYDDYTASYAQRDRITVREGRGSASMPRLVSYDDARASSRFTGSSRTSSSSFGGSTGSYGRTMVDSSLPPTMTPEGTAQVSAAASRRREGGLDSLFSSTSDLGSRSGDTGFGSLDRSLPVIGAAASAAGARKMTVLKPTSYDDVSGMAAALRSGDLVVLSLGSAPADLRRRLLDFSFGVASALDASVENLAQNVYAVSVGAGITEAERSNLQTQGLI